MAFLIAVAIGVPAGMLSAVRRDRPADWVANGVALFGISTPNFWLGIMLILLFSVELGWLPPSGYVPLDRGPAAVARDHHHAGLRARHDIAGVLMRHTRAAMLAALSQDYVRTARAKGLAERVVVCKHALRNALIPVVTLGTIEFGRLLAGAVLTEQIFTIPGFGKLIVDAVFNRDYPVVQGVVLATALIFVLLWLVADLLYMAINPRLRRRERERPPPGRSRREPGREPGAARAAPLPPPPAGGVRPGGGARSCWRALAPWYRALRPAGDLLDRDPQAAFRAALVRHRRERARRAVPRALGRARLMLAGGVSVAGCALLVGVPFGLLAGLAGGWIDTMISRVADAMLSVPFLILAIALAAFLGPALENAMLAIAVTASPVFVRLARGMAMEARATEWVEAARALGNPPWRTALVHVLPNIVPPLLVQATLAIAEAIIAEASLSFLGLGQQPPRPPGARC